MRRAVAITDKRLICLALPKGKVLWWLNLDKLDTVDVHSRGGGAKDLKFSFSSPPDRNPGWTDINQGI